MYTWSPIFHFYQPIHSADAIVSQVLYSCYLPVLELFLHNPQAKATFNISGSLSLVLERMGNQEFFIKVRELLENGQIELITSPVYHPLMPLTPLDAINRQLKQSTEIMDYFYHTNAKKILFPPELAVDESILQTFGADFEYVIVDQTSIEPDYNKEPFFANQLLSYGKTKLVINNRTLSAIFRAYPNQINQNALLSYIRSTNTQNVPLIHANDIEIFGHHYEERIHLLNALVSEKELTMYKLSEILSSIQVQDIKQIQASSWQTFPVEHVANTPFPMWIDMNNALQSMYFELMSHAHEALITAPQKAEDKGLIYASAQKHFDKGTASCHSYWLSNKPWWHPEIAEIGATELIKCIRTLPVKNNVKQQAEGLYAEFIKQLWQRNWSDIIKDNYKRYKTIRLNHLKSLPDLT